MKCISVELKIAVLIIFTAAIVGAAGYVAYQSLSNILATIKKEAQPNLTLVLLKEINSSLLQAESSIRYYTLTGEKQYLQPYYQVVQSTDNKIDLLRKYNQEIASRKGPIDSIESLISQKFGVWGAMLDVQTGNRVNTALSKLSSTIDSSVDTVTILVPKNATIRKADTIGLKQPRSEETEEKQGFFSKLFKKKPKSSDEIFHDEKSQYEAVIEPEPVVADSSLKIGVNPVKIRHEISRIKEEEDITQRMLTAREVTLSRRNDTLSQKINRLIVKLEKEELYAINQKAGEADEMVQSTHKLLTLFLVAFSVLLIGVFWVIQNYVRKSHAYQRALVRAKDEALRLSTAKERFMANVTHEIRTPMHAIVGFTEQLLEQVDQGKSKDQVEVIKNSADHLLAIINDVLDFSRFESGKFEIENIDFEPRKIIGEVHKLYKMKAASQNLEFDVHISDDLPLVLNGDPLRLKQIMLNLVSNAVKFTSVGFVNLSIDWTIAENDQIILIFQVADSGIGINSENLSHIFHEFSQAETGTTRKYGGTGLGLSIVKKLVELQKGNIHVNSNPGVGTAFTVEIPYKSGNKENIRLATEKLPINSKLLKDKRILVADDDEYNRKLISHILDKWNVNYQLAEDGIQLMQIYQNEEFDLILLDMRMPGIDGVDVAKQIRSLDDRNKSNIPLIALTATVSRDEISRCLIAGINKVISKPYSEFELFSQICLALKIEIDQVEGTVIEPHQHKLQGEELPVMFQSLYHVANNDEKFVVEMLEMFIKTSKSGLTGIHDAMKSQEWQLVAEHAHKIKSPCKHLGAGKTADLLKTIETMSRNGENPKYIIENMKEAEKQINVLIESVESFLAKREKPVSI